MTDENKRDHNAASLFEFWGAMTDENKRDHNAASLFEFGGATTGATRLSLLCPDVLLESDFIEAVWSFEQRKTCESFGLLCRLPITSQYPRHDGATAAPQRRAATRLLCNCQDTGILTPQWPPCAGDLQSTTIALSFRVQRVRHSTRTQFLHA